MRRFSVPSEVVSERLTGTDRARADIAAGRLWKARDRLQGVHYARPGDQAVLDLLGEVYFLMGDLPRAGRFWLLTERAGDEFDCARAAFDELYAHPAMAFANLPVKLPFDDYPPTVSQRLRALAEAAGVENEGRGETPARLSVGQRIGNGLLAAVAFALTLGVWAVGAIWLVAKIVSLFTGSG